ncbi:MAG: integrase/recombinase XerC [Verrucomicrobiota bacterium]|nr:integrase/recombinase XerC [Verrucomicrobiota bacterium]
MSNWTPPRGIRYSHRPERTNAPHFLHWQEDGKRHAAAYESPSAREKAAKALAEKRNAHGADVLTFDPKEWRTWLSFKNAVGEVDPLQVAHEWLAERKKAGVVASITIREASARYLESRKKDGIAKGTLTHAKMDMARFVAAFGDRLLALTPDDIRTWLAALPFAPVTKRNHYKRVSAFYVWARLEGLASVNPCESVRSPARVSDDVTVLSADDAKKLFRTARRRLPQVCARLALEAFAGLRFSSAARIVKADINFADKGITLPAAKLKTRKRHYIDGLPENLWKWLRSAPAEAWAMTERQYLTLKGDAFRLAGVHNPGNVLRHSFCSYHVAQHKDAARTAVILCHANPSTLYQHYKGRATAADAARFFGI